MTSLRLPLTPCSISFGAVALVLGSMASLPLAAVPALNLGTVEVWDAEGNKLR